MVLGVFLITDFFVFKFQFLLVCSHVHFSPEIDKLGVWKVLASYDLKTELQTVLYNFISLKLL